MFIAHVIQYIGKDFGGPVAGMAAMAAGVAELGHQVELFATHRQGDGEIINLAPGIIPHVCRDVSLGSLRHSPSLWDALKSAPCSLIHSHGLWGDPNRCAADMARSKKVPHVIGPCGLLGPVALRRSRWKKNIVRLLFQDKALHDAACLMANSDNEYRDFRSYGLVNPVAMVPNPVAGPETVINPVTVADFRSRFAINPEKKLLVFLGRIHPTKGVRRLVSIWSTLSEFHEEWHLIIAGPDEGNYQAVVQDDLEKLGCSATVSFPGPLDDRWKWGLLEAAELFVMPSKYENFGIAIVEALLAGVPVVTTSGTPWRSLVKHGAGWHVDHTRKVLGAALAEAMALSDETRHEMGARGQLLGKTFSVETIAVKLLALYRWLLDGGECPDFVETC
jgi:glycosyltransferase involved in cell wall biosynthesis